MTPSLLEPQELRSVYLDETFTQQIAAHGVNALLETAADACEYIAEQAGKNRLAKDQIQWGKIQYVFKKYAAGTYLIPLMQIPITQTARESIRSAIAAIGPMGWTRELYWRATTLSGDPDQELAEIFAPLIGLVDEIANLHEP